jgi:hypothetical protein
VRWTARSSTCTAWKNSKACGSSNSRSIRGALARLRAEAICVILRPALQLDGQTCEGIDRSVERQEAFDHGGQEIEAAADEALFIEQDLDVDAAAKAAHLGARRPRRAASAPHLQNPSIAARVSDESRKS